MADLLPGNPPLLRPSQMALVNRLIADLRAAPAWHGQLPVLLLDRCWLRLEVVPVESLATALPPDGSGEAPELARFRQLRAEGLEDWAAQLQCWEEFDLLPFQQALRRYWSRQTHGDDGWTLPAYLELLRCYRHSLECGVPHLPLLVLPRQDSGETHRLHWLQRPFASTCPSMRHTCA
ncbi:hypothetical protein H8F24_15190 [Synechococcus sp. CBW1002]|uniref:hypothetical protein n=1 Tax=Synechococcus sp. CBW1002 TaxID=1353134 RepID=UPI0018CC89CA|nr:hypothetical protein [Synechococcus sp. CBW1002]QPN59356.1 hypothetical protein H8F24_15190 [Synechococcus sp. CBW1002]